MEIIALLSTLLMASLVGSLHCLGMCGGMVAFYAGSDASTGRARWLGHAAYHGGRLVTYVALGMVAGVVGSFLDLAGKAVGIQRVGGWIVGLLMMTWGAVALARALGFSLPALPLPGWLTRGAHVCIGSVANRPPAARALLIGLLSTFLPCGWLYAFALVAAGTGSAWTGGLVMLAFWAGTVPWLLGMGLGVQWLSGGMRKHLPVLTAVVLLLVGTTFMIQRTMVPFDRAANAAHKRMPASAPAGEQPPSPQ